MTRTELRERRRIMRHRREMATPALVQLPDDSFVYADDLTRLTPREVVKIVAGAAIGLAWMFIVLFAIAFAGTTP